MTIINTYQNGNCKVTIHSDGTKVRQYEGEPKPVYPESIDVKITNWCDAGCAWCHEKSTKHGEHGELESKLNVLKQLPAGAEIAIGGGHPLSHPNFDNFVKILSENGIICNVTINEHHFLKELPRIEKLIEAGYIKGVGYSYKSKPCKWKYEHLVSHVIVGVHNYDTLESITSINKKVLLLGYKQVGRGIVWNDKNSAGVNDNIASWYRGLFSAVRKAHLSFDNLAINQLNPKRLFSNPKDYEKFYMGNDGTFSMYMDLVKQEFAVSSTSVARLRIINNMRGMFSMVANIKDGATTHQ